RLVSVKAPAPYDFDGAVRTHDAYGEPNLAVSATADAAQQFMIGNIRQCRVELGTGHRARLISSWSGLAGRLRLRRAFFGRKLSHWGFNDRDGLLIIWSSP